MKCPKCQHSLKDNQFNGVTIKECENCHGKWFDKDELGQAKDRTDDDLRWLDFDMFDEKEGKFHTTPSKRNCPKDSSEMRTLTYMDSKIMIEKCDTCRGVWLDNHEFEKIIKYLEQVVVKEPASEYAKDALKEFDEIFVGSENKISEIKDFLVVMKLFELRLALENPWSIKLSQTMNSYWPIR